jgi:hypothetical protein
MPFVVALTLDQYFDLMMVVAVLGCICLAIEILPWIIGGIAVILWFIWLTSYPVWCIGISGVVAGLIWLLQWADAKQKAREAQLRAYRQEAELLAEAETHTDDGQRYRIARAFGRDPNLDAEFN